MKNYVMFVVIIFCVFVLSLSTAIASEETECAPVQGAQVKCIDSKLIEQKYKLMVMLPSSYKENSNKKYPVVFVLDAQWDFDIMRGIYGKLYYDKDMPEVVMVGITWAGQNINIDKLRLRDFAPKKKASEGAGLFLRVLEEELIPYVESSYAVNKQRTITGTSLGGLFTTYAMLERPNLFTNVLSLAPAYHALKMKTKKRLLEKFANEAKGLKINFYLACGEYDGCNRSSKKLSQALMKLGLKKFTHRLHLIDGIKHSAATPIGNTHGLIMVFDK